MKVVILAGGLGTRISEYTKKIPKPMVPILDKPILVRLMNFYSSHGFNDFVIALGYKGQIIKDYFKKNKFKKWNVKLVDTGLKTMTGGRLKRLGEYFKKDEIFLMTYGDGLSDVNLKKLINFHKKNNALVTLTGVRPPARFGAIKIQKNKVKVFKEKSSLSEGWINGGFFVINSNFLKYIKNDSTFLERDPLEKISKKGKLFAFKHSGFWQCMDTIRDKEILENKIKKNKCLKKIF
jgi:glucose-1-phosphate cytidylyltransferase